MNTFAQYVMDFLTAQSLHVLVLFTAVLAATFLLRGRSAHIRYLLWLLVVVKCLVPPMHTVSLAVLPEAEGRIEAGGLSRDDLAEARQITPAVSEPAVVSEAQTESKPALADTADHAEEFRVDKGHPTGDSPTDGGMSFTVWIPAFWLGGAAVYFLVMAVKGVRFDRYVRRHRVAVTAQSHPAWAGFLAAAVGERRVRVYQLSRTGQPFVWGLWRPAIYLPGNFADVNDTEKQQSILMHEAGHILRLDPVVNFVQVVAQGLFWFHPLVWAANGRIRAEREKCCDEFAVAMLKAAPRSYCSAIVDALMTAQSSRPAIPTLAVAGPVKNIEDRIKTLLAPGKRFYTRPTLAVMLTILLLAAIVVPTTVALKHKLTPPAYTLSGSVVDADGKPIAGAIVFDDGYGPEPYQKGITDANGKFEYKSWNEEHNVTAKAEGFAPQTITFTSWPFDNSRQLNFTLQRATEGELTALPNGVLEAILLPEHLESHTVLSLKTGQFIPQQQADEAGEPYLFYGYTFPPGANPRNYTVDTIPEDCLGVEAGKMDLAGGGWGKDYESAYGMWLAENTGQLPTFHPLRLKLMVVNQMMDGTFIVPPLDTDWPYMSAFRGDDGTLGVFEIRKVENRNIHIRFKTLTAKTDQEPQQNTAFAAVLDNGVTVELLGVCEHPSEGKQWWRPNGFLLEKVPYQTMGSRLTHDTGFNDYEFVLRTDSPSDTSFKVQVPGGKHGTYTGTPYDREGNRIVDLRVYTANQPEEKDSTWVRIGATADKWQTRAVYKHDDHERTYDFDRQSVGFNRPYENNGDTVLPCTHNLNIPQAEVDIRVVAIRKDGGIRLGSCSGYGGNVLHSSTYQFKSLSLEEIKQFEFQTRPYEWLIFKNVSLRPGVKTNVEAVIGQAQSVKDERAESPNAKTEVFLPAIRCVLDLSTGNVMTFDLENKTPAECLEYARQHCGCGVGFDHDGDTSHLGFINVQRVDRPTRIDKGMLMTSFESQKVPLEILVWGNDGKRYAVNILNAENAGCTIAYSRLSGPM